MDLVTRCPRLGGEVPFRYCLSPGEPDPCYKILDCWWQIFDVVGYLSKRLSREAFGKILERRRPRNRLEAIVEAAERVKRGEGK